MNKRKIIFSLSLLLFVCLDSLAVGYPKREVRAVWLTTIGGLDWPHSYSQSERSMVKQQEELREILDKLQRANINTVLIQTRIRATSLFATTADSGNEPWDGCLSGFPGKSPGYDALAFAVEECHRRGMECHAWVVAIPVGKWNDAGCQHLRKALPGIVYRIGQEGYMRPEDSRTAVYLARYCADIARRYDVDGISLDYIRYPEAQKRLPSADVGRANITRIVKAVHDSVKAVKPWVKLSCSPVGKHDDTRRYWSRGWNARSRVLQDAKEWMRLGYMDQEYPMMYFRGDNFYPFAVDWIEGCHGKAMVPGLGIYMLHPRESNWSLDDITRELHVLRHEGAGFCMFRSKFFTDNVKGIYDFVSQSFCPYPALTPVMCGYGNDSIAAPEGLDVRRSMDGTTISWSSCGDDIVYNIYVSESYPVDVNRAENLLCARRSETSVVIGKAMNLYFAVTAMDRYGNESKPCQEEYAEYQKEMKPGWYWVTHPLGR